MKPRYIHLCFLILFMACGTKSKYRKAADEIASKMPDSGNMNAVAKSIVSMYLLAGQRTTELLTE